MEKEGGKYHSLTTDTHDQSQPHPLSDSRVCVYKQKVSRPSQKATENLWFPAWLAPELNVYPGHNLLEIYRPWEKLMSISLYYIAQLIESFVYFIDTFWSIIHSVSIVLANTIDE